MPVTPPDFGRPDPDRGLVLPDGLTTGHRATIDSFRGLNGPADWFVKPPDPDGQVSVIVIGDDFVWSILIQPDGDYAASGATLGPWETGINC